MLKITIPAGELFDNSTGTFYYTKETTIVLEHSLVSLAKWESKWKKPFLGKNIPVQMFDDYIRCMTITQNVNPDVYLVITPGIRKQIRAYMEDPMTAAVVSDDPNQKQSRQFVTSDLIYYWMVALNIPFECQKWHLNRLLMLIKITSVEQKTDNKMSKSDSARYQHAQNVARRAKRKARR